MKSPRLLLTAATVAVGLSSTACSNIEGRANDRLFPTARVIFDLNEGGLAEPAEPGEKARRRFFHGFEFSGTGTQGSFRLDDNLGRADFQIVNGSALYRFGVQGRRGYFHGLVGVSLDNLSVDDNPTVDISESYFGPLIGFEGRVRLRDWLHPYMREQASFLEEGSFSNQWEIGMMFTPAPEFDLFAAYRRWDGYYGDAGPNGRDLDLEWRGVVLGMVLHL
ncbi:MAG: hypothetical protein R3F29_13085 [Planctomycetota bacterium]